MKNTETLLHYIWKNMLHDFSGLTTTNDIPISVIDPGVYNINAGPDFFNAKIKIGKQIWAGNVEIHLCASDWLKHGHHKDKAYNSVILHVVEEADKSQIRSENGEIIPLLVLPVPKTLRQNYEYLLNRDSSVSCIERITDVHPLYLTDWLSALLAQRLEKKTEVLFNLLDTYNGDWLEVFYIILSRNFGFGINNDAFERLAKSLPLKCILRHKDSSLQVDALFLGQAGLLNEELKDEYYFALQKEYHFLRKKFRLEPLDSHIFKSLRMRPNNFPHIKIVQLSALVRNQGYLFSKLLEVEDISNLRQLFVSKPDLYWLTHYHFQKKSIKKEKMLGQSALNIILINTAVPFLFAYGKKKNKDHLTNRAICLLEMISPERNSIVNLFSRAGINVKHAGDSQALIQLKKEYCEKKKCIFCRIGHKLLSKP